MYDTADVWTYGVDGSVGAETCGVDPQVSGALFDHISDDVDLRLGKAGEKAKSWMLYGFFALKMEVVIEKLYCFYSKLFSFFLNWHKGVSY